MVVLSGAVLSGWYAWYAAFSLMHIKYKYGSRDRDDFGDFFLPSSNSLKIALVTCCCCGNCRNSETSAMSGGFSTKGQCWSGLPWTWLQVLGGLSWSTCWLFLPIYPLQTHPPIYPQRAIWGEERQVKHCCFGNWLFFPFTASCKAGVEKPQTWMPAAPQWEAAEVGRQVKGGAGWNALHLISVHSAPDVYHSAPDISAQCTWCAPQCTWYQCMAGGFGAVWCTEEQHSNKTETTPSNSDQQTWLHAKRKL